MKLLSFAELILLELYVLYIYIILLYYHATFFNEGIFTNYKTNNENILSILIM